MIKFRFALAPAGAVAVAAAALLAVPSGPARACAPESYIGSVCFTAASFCPDGMYTLTYNTQPIDVRQDPATYSLIGNLYGGTRGQTFGVPNLSGATVAGNNPSSGGNPGLSPVQVGTSRGKISQTLSWVQMPSHTHQALFNVDTSKTTTQVTLQATGAAGNEITPPTNAALAGTTTPMWAPALTNPVTLAGTSAAISGGFTGGTVVNADSGAGKAFATMPPSVVLTACMPSAGSSSPYPYNPNN